MTFWTSEKIKQRVPNEGLVDPYSSTRVKHAAYELSLGPEVLITSQQKRTKYRLKDGESVVIPPGQFGLLLTEEVVQIPPDSIGLISMRFGVKSRGLINVSGFHVDPGFSGRLKFSVYNAGSTNIVVSRGDPIFLLWLCDLSSTTSDIYNGSHVEQIEITSEDQNRMQGRVASPAQLAKDIDRLRRSIRNQRIWIGIFASAIFVPIAVGIAQPLIQKALQWAWSATPPSSTRTTTQPTATSQPAATNP
jgi:dCTP deaminase